MTHSFWRLALARLLKQARATKSDAVHRAGVFLLRNRRRPMSVVTQATEVMHTMRYVVLNEKSLDDYGEVVGHEVVDELRREFLSTANLRIYVTLFAALAA
jgi:hypothetical protein